MKFFKWMMVAFVAMWLAACGGGGGSGGNSLFGGGAASGTTTLNAKVALSATVVTAAAPITVTTTVTDSAGSPVSGATVALTLGTSTMATLRDTSLVTGADGVAKTVITALSDTVVGEDTVTAAVTLGTVASAKTTVTFKANSASVIELLTSANTISTAGDEVTISAVVKSVGGVGLAGAPVTFSSNTGTLKSPASKTDATGSATVKFTAGADRANRTATIQVSSGAATASIVLPIAGSRLSVSGATTVPFGTTSVLTVKATDEKGNLIPGATLTASSSLGNGLSQTSLTTDANGQALVTYSATNAGTDTVSFSGLGASTAQAIAISSVDFVFVSPASTAQLPVSTPQTLQVRYRQSGVGVSGTTISFSATGGALSATTAVTDVNGVAQVSIQSTSAAPATVRATLPSGVATATLPINFVATTPNTLVLQVSPTALGPNTSGLTTNQAQMVARVIDANGNPVAGKLVNFMRDADPSGGDLSPGSATTDVTGQATVQYVAGSQSTANNAVILRATVAGTAVTGTASLTVSQSALFLALGTGNEISNIDPQTYQKDWTVYVTDANGVAVPNVSVTAKILPKNYRKGRLLYASTWGAVLWDGQSIHTVTDGNGGTSLAPGYYISCANEDATYGPNDTRSFNGIRDAGEDFNGDGVLQPGNVIALKSGALKTDANGRATISLVYAESYVPWLEVTLQVQAIVSGTASSTSSTFVVNGSAADFNNDTVTPAAVISPFGMRTVCSDPL